MSDTLAAGDFAAFFAEVHERPPFPWQMRLVRDIAQRGEWYPVLDLPTGSGKTAALDIALFHLALEADRGAERRAPVRIAFIVDRRLVVDDAYARARTIAQALAADPPPGPVTAHVARRLRALSDDGMPLLVRRLRGGIPFQDDWARTPSQPTILCSTVDQVGSRLLFRGYGVSDRMKPVHAGLLGSDCLLLLDEAHLAEPFRQTLGWVKTYRGERWREETTAGPWGAALLTATPRQEATRGTKAKTSLFALDDDDYHNPILSARWTAAKPARLIGAAKRPRSTESEEGAEEGDEAERMRLVTMIVAEVREALAALKEEGSGVEAPAIGVVVNRVARARAVHRRLETELAAEIDTPILLIGPARSVDRDELADALNTIRTGAARTLGKPLIIVATQCVEAGVDIDLDALVTEAAPIDSLRQRFGRLNRAGRDIKPYAAIVATRSVLSPRHDDPVYGKAIKPAWDYLTVAANEHDGVPIVDFGLAAFATLIERAPIPDEACAPKSDAPVLLPAHLDLLSQTAPIPASDPDLALYLHGPNRQPDAVTLIWRGDVEPPRDSEDEREASERVRRLLMLMPPRAGEAIELPVWAVRSWLQSGDSGASRLADTSVLAPEADVRAPRGGPRRPFCWKGDDERSRWVRPHEIKPGDTVVIPGGWPMGYGGLDQFGWNPELIDTAVPDVADRAASPYASRRFTVRVAPGLIEDPAVALRLSDTLANAPSRRWHDLRDRLTSLDLPHSLEEQLAALDRARRGRVEVHLDLYGDDEGRPRGVVFVARLGLEDIERRQGQDEGRLAATEDDTAGSLPGFEQQLDEHSSEVASKAEAFARSAGVSAARIADLALAGYLHDAGKADPRFQAWLYGGDPLGADPELVLAKSARPLPRDARERSGLPDNWRHEALSVRLAILHPRFAQAHDPELVLWLVGTHHGYGRPLFPHADPRDAQVRELRLVPGQEVTLPAGAGPQSLAFDFDGSDWAGLFARLKARYGVWELGRMEAILRLADHRASEEAERRYAEGDAA